MKASRGSKIKAANTSLIVKGEIDRVPEFFAPDYIVRLTRGEANGHEAVRRHIGMLHRAFPKLQVKVEILVEQSDRVAWQRTFSGIQLGPFYGFPATGRRTAWREMITSAFHVELISEEWLVSDLGEQLLRTRKNA
jgi:predicted ester cyclase